MDKENDPATTESKTDENARSGDASKAEQKCDSFDLKAEKLPLLLEDSTLQTLPQYVQNMLEHVDTQNMTQNDLLTILVVCMALESGFSPINEVAEKCVAYWGYTFNSRNVHELAQLPDGYCEVRDTVYRFHMKLLYYNPKKCLLFCVRTGDSFCVTLTPEDLPGKSIFLSTSRYVLSTQVKNVAGRMRNLKEFSFLLRQQIFMPIRNTLLEEINCFYPGLGGLPLEILTEIRKYLAFKDIWSLRRTCTKLYGLVPPEIWNPPHKNKVIKSLYYLDLL